MSWDPQVEQRPHPFGEAGVRSSLEEVCKRAAEGASELLGNPKHLARVRTWAIDRLHRAKARGEPADRPGDRARILLKAVQDEKLWVPDPIGIEYIPKAHLMACDGDTHDDGTPCVKGDDCFAQGTLVLTDERVGEAFVSIPVERLQPGMKIWGLERWSTVVAVWAKGELAVDEIGFGTSPLALRLTPDHHVYVIKDGVEKRITVAELQPGDVMPGPIEPGVENCGVGHLRVRSIHRDVAKVQCWDITTDDHRVYLPEHDVTVSQCDGKVVFFAACCMAVGLYTMIVGHSYTKDGVIGHVLTKVYFDGKWHYADVSPLGNGKYMELGKSAPFTRERYYSMPTIKVVCDAASCDVRNFDPQELGFVQQGTFVGVNGIAVMEMPPVVEWLGAPVVEWLGEYKADDALSKEIIARKGDTSEESLKAYGQAAGAMGGGAACLAFGVSAPVAGGCAILGGLIGGVIASMVPVAKGSDLQDAVVDTWKSWTAPNLKWSQRALLAVKAYYVMREEAVDAAVAAGATASWAEGYLVQHGLTKEPTPGRWAPRPERYNHPLVCTAEPCASVQAVVSDSDWKECGAAKSVGINLECRTYLQLTYGPWPPVAGKNDEVDWGLVGWDEIAVERDMKQKYKTTGCNMNANGTMIPITCPSVKPSAWARESVIKLKLVQAKMLVEAKGSGGALEYRSMPSAPAKSKGAVIVGGLSAAAGLAWWVWSKGLLK